MKPFRIFHVTDTHLTASHPWILANFDAMSAIVAKERPDLVINTGDISFNGVDADPELPFARARHDALAAPVRFVPGNHDLGDNPWGGDGEHRISAARRDLYREHFG